MRELHDHAELLARCDGDLVCVWAAGGLGGRGRAWVSADGRALAVAGAGLSERDRLAVHGDATALVPLAGKVLAEVGPTFRPFGAPDLVTALVAGLPGLVEPKTFGWMDHAGPLAENGTGRARWLGDGDLAEVTGLLGEVFPRSHARPGVPGVQRWAGIRDGAGRLLAVAALAWSAPTVGLLSGVAVGPLGRGQGLGREICAFVAAEAVRRYGAVALMVEQDNHPARHVYAGLGLRYRALAATWIGG